MHLILVIFFVSSMKVTISGQETECSTDSCKKYAKLLQKSLDKSVDPCEDFSSFVCGNYGESHKIQTGESSTSSFDDVTNEITLELKQLLESQEVVDENLPQTKAAIYYKSCLNVEQRNKVSNEVIKEYVNKLYEESGYFKKIRKLIRSGINSRLFSVVASEDSKNAEYYILNVGKGQLILPEATLRSSEVKDVTLINNYKIYMNKVLDIFDLWTDKRYLVDDIINVNIAIAKALPTIENQQNLDKSYNKVSIKELESICPHISWNTFFNDIIEGTGKILSESDNVVIFSMEYIKKICNITYIYSDIDPLFRILEADVAWTAISSLIQHGSEKLLAASDEYFNEMLGINGKKELWKKCVEETSSTMVDIVGNMYVKGNFDSKSKTNAEEMLLNIKAILKKEIEEINWMDQETKNMALLKLRLINQKIGYSEKILNENKLAEDYAKININEEQYIKSHIALKEAQFIKSMEGIGEKRPEDKWLIGPQIVNAYYNYELNEIVFPAAIFRFPFYDKDFPLTLNYGGIGTFIGHEILHGFDSTGSQYDEKGNLRDWWTPETKTIFNEKTQCIVNQYKNYTIYNKTLPAERTFAEDIADNSGTRMAFKASQMSEREKTILPGHDYTSQQLFFINQAMSWCSVITKESLLERIKTDDHTVWSFRIKGPLSNMPEFSQAFNCNADQEMNRLNKCVVW